MSKKSAVVLDPVVENAKCYKDTDHQLADRCYNWVIRRYTKHNHLFNFSDKFVWTGAFYVVPEFAGYIIFFIMFYWLGGIIYNKYGLHRMIAFFFLLTIWRLNIANKSLKKLNDRLKVQNGKENK